MSTIARVLVALVALLHAYFLVLEMFLWTKPAGRRAFGTTQEQAEQSKALAMNEASFAAGDGVDIWMSREFEVWRCGFGGAPTN